MSQVGKPYRPSNGSEGLDFQAQFCDRCRKDEYPDGPEDKWCPILAQSYAIWPEAVPEWKYDENEQPTCTAFEPREDAKGGDA